MDGQVFRQTKNVQRFTGEIKVWGKNFRHEKNHRWVCRKSDNSHTQQSFTIQWTKMRLIFVVPVVAALVFFRSCCCCCCCSASLTNVYRKWCISWAWTIMQSIIRFGILNRFSFGVSRQRHLPHYWIFQLYFFACVVCVCVKERECVHCADSFIWFFARSISLTLLFVWNSHRNPLKARTVLHTVEMKTIKHDTISSTIFQRFIQSRTRHSCFSLIPSISRSLACSLTLALNVLAHSSLLSI